jgi:hypothetical protein
VVKNELIINNEELIISPDWDIVKVVVVIVSGLIK